MFNSIKVRISDLNIEINYNFKRIPELCQDYICDFNNADIKVEYDEQKCKSESEKSGFSINASEFSCIYRQIAEQLPFFSRAVCHGAVISYKDNGYMFIAKSGTGKTTHINLWQKYISGTKVINGDKPIIELKNEKVIAYGTPWSGKERMQNNTSAKLKGICLVRQSKQNSIRKLDKKEALDAIIKQIYMPENSQALNLTIGIIDGIISDVPFYELSCDISREAVMCSYRALTGEK